MNKEEIKAMIKDCVYSEDGITYMSDKQYNNYIDTIVQLQQENQSLKKENKILRENAEHNDKVVDKVNWENMLLKKENKQIKEKLSKIETQQKEFIEYMNKTIEELECDDVDDEEMKGYLIQRIDTFKEILSKYKEIIGDINDKK